jgi:hypothetical protein
LRRRLYETARQREEALRRLQHEQEQKRLTQDAVLETKERQEMQQQELVQCRIDNFWGIQKEEQDALRYASHKR